MIFEALRCLLGKILFFCSSVGNDSFPKPLSPAEEADCLRRFRENGDAEAKDKLIRHNLRLVAHIAKKYQGAEDADDLISVGSVGLIKAINTYEPGKGTQLATYTARCIENEILMYLRRVVRLKGEVSLDEPLNVDWEGNELLLSDVLGTDNDVVYKDIEIGAEHEMLREAIAKLSPREKKIMDLRFGLGGREEMTQKEVADLLGISQSYISRLEKKIVSRLRKEMKKLG